VRFTKSHAQFREREIPGGQFVRELPGASPMINESGLPPPFKAVVACRPPGIFRSPQIGVWGATEQKTGLRNDRYSSSDGSGRAFQDGG
jgi:hypothetical protein